MNLAYKLVLRNKEIPNKIAIIQNNQKITYNDLYKKSIRI